MGGFVLNYGQFMFGWESLYFDGHLARPVLHGSYLDSGFLIDYLTPVEYIHFAVEET